MDRRDRDRWGLWA